MNEHQALVIGILETQRGSTAYATPSWRPHVAARNAKIDATIAAVNAAFADAQRYAKLGWMIEATNKNGFVLFDFNFDDAPIQNKLTLDALLDKEPTL